MALPSIAQLFPSGALAPASAKGYIQQLLQSLIDNFGDMASRASAQKAFGVAVVDRAYNQQTGINSLAPKIPYDNTIPQSNEGTLYHQAAITPKSVTNRIRGRVQCPCGSSWNGADAAVLAVFVNNETSARWSVGQLIADGGLGQLYCEFEYVPGTLATQTIAVRIGCNAGSIIPNGNRSSVDLGGKMTSTLVLEELTA